METIFDSLPVDILLHLFNFMSEKDCITFSLSGVSDRFSFLCGERRTLSIKQCYFITHNLFHKYLSSWVCPEVVTCLDTSHCYWLPSDFLLNVVSSMSHLTTLCIQDTKLNLSYLWQIFKSCHHIVKISISLSENDGDIFEKMQEGETSSFEILSNGFTKLTHLKILAFNGAYYIDSWLLILQLLSLCQKCVDLHLEIVYSEEYFRYGPFGKDDYDDVFVNRVRGEFFPNLNWMASLKNFVILKRGGLISYPDECVKSLVNWVFSQYNMNCVERVWIMEDVGIRPDIIASGNKLKSILCCGQLSSFHCNYGRFGQLEHIGGVGLENWGQKRALLPNLRYIHGYCVSSEGVDELCRTHPKLQHLHLNDNNGYLFYIKDDWMLNHLKKLVYNCSFPRKEILETFLKATPNLEALHIGYSNRSALDPWTPLGYKSSTSGAGADCLKMIRCDRLTTLSLNAFYLFEGDFFETIFNGCPQLRNLHICGGLSGVKCFNNLCRYLPLAEKLRDFRLQYAYEYEGDMPNQTLLNALLECKRLKRIVLYEEDGPNIPPESLELQDVLLKFVSSMPHLVCFCYITASEIEPGMVAGLKQKFDEFILPVRPAFWYHVDQSLPRATDPTVPRIHYDQIVSPINYFEMSPDF